MAGMSYGAAGVAPPAVGSDNSPTFFRTYFDFFMLTFNADDTIITNANAVGSVANAGKLAKYDSLGGLTLNNLAVTAGPVTIDGTGRILTSGALGVTGLASLNGGAAISGAIILSGGAVTADAGGNIVTAGNVNINGTHTVHGGVFLLSTLSVTGATGLAALTVTTFLASGLATFSAMINANGGITGALTGRATVATTADAFTTPQLFSTTVADYKPGTNAAAGVISVAAGGSYIGSDGVIVVAGSATTAALSNAVSASQPTGTNFQYVGISKAPSTGNLVATGAALNAAENTLIFPTGNTPVAVVLWRGATTNPTNVIAAVDIFDVRGGAAGSNGGGVSGLPATAPILTNGPYTGTAADSLDVTAANPALAIHPANVRDSIYGGSPSDILAGTAKADTIGRLSSVGAVASLVYSAASPWAVAVNGRTRAANNPATQPALTATASGTANQQRTLVVDLGAATAGAADHGIRLAFIAPGTALGTYQMPVANYWWDGTTITPADNTAMSHVVDYTPVAGLSMAGVTPVLAKFSDTGANATFSNLPNASFTTLSNINTITVPALPTTMQPYISLRFNATPTVAVGTQVQVVILVDGSFVAGFIEVLASVDSTFPRMVRFDGWLPPMAPGPHTVTIAAIGVGNTTNALSVSAGLTYGHIAFYKG